MHYWINKSVISFLLAWGTFCACLEFFLPGGSSSWWDVLAVAINLVFIGLVVWLRDYLDPSFTFGLKRIVQKLKSWIFQYIFRIGVDFRGTPPMEKRIPTFFVVTGLISLGIVVLTFLSPHSFPFGFREKSVALSSSLYIMALTCLWLWDFFVAFISGYFAWIHINDSIQTGRNDRLKGKVSHIGIPLALFLCVLCASLLLPVYLPFYLMLGVVTISTVMSWFIPSHSFRLVWQSFDNSKIYHLSLVWVLFIGLSSVVGFNILTSALATMSSWTTNIKGPTIWVGLISGWSGVLGGVAWLWTTSLRLMLLSNKDPSRPVPTSLKLLHVPQDPEFKDSLESKGFILSKESSRHTTELRLNEDAPRQRVTYSSSEKVWQIHPYDLLHAEVLSELKALDRQSRRQEILEVIQECLNKAKDRHFEAGSGYWFAPHLWYLKGMTRDTDESDSIFVSLPYHQIFTKEARHHCYELYTGLDLDLIFIEDAVKVESVIQVFNQVFDRLDLWGKHRIEDHHIRGIPSVRVLIHSFENKVEWKNENYPEPDYEEISRARILHIMKDRGGDEDPVIPDFDPTQKPQLLGV